MNRLKENFKDFSGYTIVDHKWTVLGTITHQFWEDEDNEWWGCVDDEYEIRITDVTYHIDLMGVLRERHNLPKECASFI